MTPQRRLAPSRIRYAAAHPAHTVRFSPETHAKIVAICERTGLSYNRAVNIAVDGLDDAALEVIRSHAHELGIQEGVKVERTTRAAAYAESHAKFWLTLPCPKCGQPIELRARSLVAIRAIPDFWAHEICPSPPDGPGAPASDVR